jgi:7,8-dihydropterin-6-yl-methyl-4-(beta-D-ribofuranosyl)aminobenzene 5'-phosphate synthase
MNSKIIARRCAGALATLSMLIACTAGARTEAEHVRIAVVYNNVPHVRGLTTGWGFAALVETGGRTILFDTGGDGTILLDNMHRLGLDPKAVDAVVLSHIHADHTGGLEDFLEHNPNVTVYMPDSFPASFRKGVQRSGAKTVSISGPQQIMDSVYSTGEMGRAPGEQAMIIDTLEGLIVITGCAHPNVGDMAERARAYLGTNIYLLMGGFHLSGRSDDELHAIVRRLKALGVRKVAPSHCTGDSAIRMFRNEWGDDFIEGGLGAVIAVP